MCKPQEFLCDFHYYKCVHNSDFAEHGGTYLSSQHSEDSSLTPALAT